MDLDEAKVLEMLSAGVESNVSQVTGLSPAQRLTIFSSVFTASVHQMELPESAVVDLIVESERRAIANGWRPALAADDIWEAAGP
jgi:hypothetical protein